MSIFDDIELSEYVCECPNCGSSFASSKPLPGCNECECCFCSENCREQFHKEQNIKHDYKKHMQDFS